MNRHKIDADAARLLREQKDALARLARERDEADRACEETIAERDGWEQWCTDVARLFGCVKDWTSSPNPELSHDHRLCILDAVRRWRAKPSEAAEWLAEEVRGESDLMRKHARERQERFEESLAERDQLRADLATARERIAELESGFSALHQSLTKGELLADAQALDREINALRALLDSARAILEEAKDVVVKSTSFAFEADRLDLKARIDSWLLGGEETT